MHTANDRGGAWTCLCLAVAEENTTGHVFAHLRLQKIAQVELPKSLFSLNSSSSQTSSSVHSVGSNSMFSLLLALPVCILHSSWCNQGFAGLVKDWESGRIIVWGVTVGWFLPPPCILTTVLFFSFIIRIMQQYYTEHSAACKAEGVQYYVTMETKFRKGFWSSCNYIQSFVKHRFWLLRA